MTDAKTEILNKIRMGLAAARAEEGFCYPSEVSGERVGIPPIPQSTSLVDMFAESLESVGGFVHRCGPGEGEVAIQELLKELQVERVAYSSTPPGLKELLQVEAGVSSAQWGIAETGTIVLTSDEEQSRLVSLVPPIHVALLLEDNVLPNLDEALVEVYRDNPADMSRAITWITGPSRTADIELTLVVGVHGPRQLHVILEAAQ